MSKIKYTHHLSDLVFEALLKVFNRKSTFLRYLQQKFNNRFNFYDSHETKRELLTRIYPSILKTENGQKIIVEIAIDLSSYNDFPDLKGFEDSEQKINNAKDSIQYLKKYLYALKEQTARDEENKKNIELYRNEQEKIKINKMSLSKLEKELYDISNRMGQQLAGYEFEKWFFSLLDFFEVTCKRPYRTADKRQIDGAISINGTDYIVELKFTKNQTTTDDLDSLHSKLKSKADNTLALCVSMSGFTENAKTNAAQGRTMILLLDHTHIFYILRGIMSFEELIDRIKRHASQTGESYIDISKL